MSEQIKIDNSNSINSETKDITVETNSTKLTVKSFWTTNIEDIIAQHMDLQLCSSPWDVTFLDKDGNVDKKAQARWKQIASISQWERLPSRLVKKMVRTGHGDIATLIYEHPIFGKIPWLLLVNTTMYYKQADFTYYAQYIAQLTQGTYPLITTIETTPGKVKFLGYSLNDKPLNTKKLPVNVSLPKVKDVIDYKVNFTPLNRFENITGDGQSETGSPDLNNGILGLTAQLDVIWEKMKDEIANNTTYVQNTQVQGSWTNTTAAGREASKGLVQEQMNNSFREFTMSNNYPTGDVFKIFPMTPQLTQLRDEFNNIIMMISFMFGGIPMLDRLGSYQQTNAQSHTSNRNTSEYIVNKKAINIKAELEKLLINLIQIDKENGIKVWDNVNEIMIDVIINEMGLEYIMKTNPKGLRDAGYSAETIIKQTQKVSHQKALEILRRNEKFSNEFPNIWNSLTGKKEGQSNGGVDKDIKSKLPNSETQIKQNDSGE